MLTDEDKLLVDQLTSEYQIIQDKIDKIGSFRFTVRGWSVTLVIGSIFAAGSDKEVSPFLVLLLIVFVLMFYFSERKQNRFEYVFGDRAFRIERDLRRIIRSNAPAQKLRNDIGPTPWIAYHLKVSEQKVSPPGHFRRLRRWVQDPDSLFYVWQIVVIIIATLVLLHFRSRPPETQKASVATVRQSSQLLWALPDEVFFRHTNRL